MNITRIAIVAVLAAALIFTGCDSSKTVKGGGIGAATGALIGGILGHAGGNTTEGVLIGAAVGGAAGAAIGHYMDKQAEEMKQIDNANVERVGEGIKITFDSGILFKTGSADLSTTAKGNVQKLADILKKYPDTNVLIQGHTDSTGSADFNQTLSEKRAASVADYCTTFGVDKSRIKTEGYGKTMPVADNKTAEGRQKNRRVEVAVSANDKLKQTAQNGELKVD